MRRGREDQQEMQVVDKKIEEIRGKGGVMRRGERREVV